MNSNRIGQGGNAGAAQQLPWPQESSQVQGLRRAITAHMGGGTVDTDVAPMMSELLARLESFVEPVRSTDLRPPPSPDPANPPGPAEAMSALGRACDACKELVSGRPNGESGQRIAAMVEVVSRHLEMKHEIVFRVEQPGAQKA